MKNPLLLAAASSLAMCLSASAGTFNVFKAAIMVPVSFTDPVTFKTVTKTLTAKEFINLTLGQPLDTPLGTRILALMLNFEGPTTPGQPPPTPETKLVVWDTSLTTVDKTVATVAPLTELDYDAYEPASTDKGQGIATATIAAGTDPNNKFFDVTLHGAGQVSEPQSRGINVINSAGLKLTGLSARVHFKYTDAKHPTSVDVFGIALKGSLTTAGKPIAPPFFE